MTIDEATKILAVNHQMEAIVKDQRARHPMLLITWSDLVERATGIMEGVTEIQEREQKRAENNGLGRSTLELALELQRADMDGSL